jgi:hypothetical protein
VGGKGGRCIGLTLPRSCADCQEMWELKFLEPDEPVNRLYPSQLRCGLKRGSTAARLLGLRVRIPPEAWMPDAYVVCCQVEVSVSD